MRWRLLICCALLVGALAAALFLNGPSAATGANGAPGLEAATLPDPVRGSVGGASVPARQEQPAAPQAPPAPPALVIRVVDEADDSALPGVPLRLSWRTGKEVRNGSTGADGSWRLPFEPGMGRVVILANPMRAPEEVLQGRSLAQIRHELFRPRRRRRNEPEGDRVVTLRARRAGVVAGRVTDLAGHPVPGARVGAWSSEDDGSVYPFFSFDFASIPGLRGARLEPDPSTMLVETTSGSDGSFRLPGVLGSVSLMARAPGIVAHRTALLFVAPDETASGLLLRVAPARSLAVTVVDALGQPPPDLLLWAVPAASAATAATGSKRIHYDDRPFARVLRIDPASAGVVRLEDISAGDWKLFVVEGGAVVGEGRLGPTDAALQVTLTEYY